MTLDTHWAMWRKFIMGLLWLGGGGGGKLPWAAIQFALTHTVPYTRKYVVIQESFAMIDTLKIFIFLRMLVTWFYVHVTHQSTRILCNFQGYFYATLSALYTTWLTYPGHKTTSTTAWLHTVIWPLDFHHVQFKRRSSSQDIFFSEFVPENCLNYQKPYYY